MCGIVGCVGSANPKSKLFEMLKQVEYRGYDSVGIATIVDKEIDIIKEIGEVDTIASMVGNTKGEVCGIGHTRWATHGGVTRENAHPHLSNSGEWAVVHNGIIENYLDLKRKLENDFKIKFKSDTDTEVISQLLGTKTTGSNLEKIKFVCDSLIGSFALAIINKNENKIYLAKRGSPLYVGVGKKESFVASDTICFANYCNKYFSLDDGEFACVGDNNVGFYDNNLEVVVKNPQKVDCCAQDIIKGECKHLMEKEIWETGEALKNISEKYSAEYFEKVLGKALLKRAKNIVFIGCGTAYHAGLMGEKYFEKYCGISSRTYIASEFRYSDVVIPKNTIAILVSQSGETADTIVALGVLRGKGVPTIALTNVLHSSIARGCEYVLPVCAGIERAVASTKAYSAQVAVLYLLAKYTQSLKQSTQYYVPKSLEGMGANINKIHPQPRDIVDEVRSAGNVFFIGRNQDYVTSLEASLKLKEITYINSSAYPSGELKHGFLALVDNTTLVFAIATDYSLLSKTLNNAYEVSARAGRVVLVTTLDIEKKPAGIYKIIKIPSQTSELASICTTIFFQWLAYYSSISLGINPDKPRNLAKSVTVE